MSIQINFLSLVGTEKGGVKLLCKHVGREFKKQHYHNVISKDYFLIDYFTKMTEEGALEL